MADTITLKSSSYDGRYMKLVCEQTPNGSDKNTSTIKWTLSTVGGSNNYYSTGPTEVIINGTTVYSKSRVEWNSAVFPASKDSISGKITIAHKTDGTKSIKVSLSTAIYTGTVSTYSDTWKLDPIARYGTSKQSLNSKTETSIKINWSSDNTVDYLWYSTDNGSSWAGLNVADGKSGTYTISGLKANTTYKIKTRIRRKDSQLTTDSSALSVTTYNYPYCTDSPDFVLGDIVTLKFYNPLSRAFKFYIIGNGTQIGTEYDCNSTEYKGLGSLMSTVPYLYATIPNDPSAEYKVKVVYGDSIIIRNNGNTYSVKESECLPTFTTFNYKDTNEKVTAVTGNNQVIVKGLSTLEVEILSADKMETKNSATPKNYVASIDTISKPIPYSSTDTVSEVLGVVSSAGTKRLNVTAYDSRNLPKTAHKDITVFEYAKPIVNVSAKRLNNFEAQTTLSVSGNFSRITIDDSEKNTIKNVEYRYRVTGGEWSNPITLTTTITGDKFTCNNVIVSLDNNEAFELEITVTDNLSNNTASATVDVGQAVFFISTNKRKCYINNNEVATLDSTYPVGAVYCSATNTNPSALFGGEWVLTDKEFTPKTTVITQSPTDYLSQLEVISIRTGHTLRLRLALTTNKELNDTETTLGTVDLSQHGCVLKGGQYFPYGVHGDVSISDGGSALIDLDFRVAGEITTRDVLVNGSGGTTHTLPVGASFFVNTTLVIFPENMEDSACNKFYWKRTA